jgi:hypothetical protein
VQEGGPDPWDELKEEARSWENLRGDLGFWAIVLVVVLVVDLVVGAISGTSGTKGTVVVVIAIACVVAIAGLGIAGFLRSRREA